MNLIIEKRERLSYNINKKRPELNYHKNRNKIKKISGLNIRKLLKYRCMIVIYVLGAL